MRTVPYKLYIWDNPGGIRWGTDTVLAVAKTERAAKKLGEQAAKGQVVLGRPTRVLALPAAHYLKWEE